MCFDQCVASCIDLWWIILRMHSTNVFFRSMCLARIIKGLTFYKFDCVLIRPLWTLTAHTMPVNMTHCFHKTYSMNFFFILTNYIFSGMCMWPLNQSTFEQVWGSLNWMYLVSHSNYDAHCPREQSFSKGKKIEWR